MTRLALALLVTALPLSASAATPARVIEASLQVPAGMDADEALAAVDDLPAIFADYEPVVPWVPGVRMELAKEVISTEAPVVMALPLAGSVFGRSITERAQVTALVSPHACASGTAGRRIELSFVGSSHNVERRVDRIEIVACPRDGSDGSLWLDARGELFEGHLPRDPKLNAFEENIGARALQTAFIRQVPAVFEAVEHTWAVRLSPAG